MKMLDSIAVYKGELAHAGAPMLSMESFGAGTTAGVALGLGRGQVAVRLAPEERGRGRALLFGCSAKGVTVDECAAVVIEHFHSWLEGWSASLDDGALRMQRMLTKERAK